MILDDKQLKIAKEQLGQLKGWIAEIESRDKQSDNLLRKLQLSGFRGFASETERDIDEYENLVRGVVEVPETVNLDNLPKLLIEIRISRSWSQEKLAEVTNTTLPDLCRYESNCYLGASLSKKMEVAAALNIDASAIRQANLESETNVPTITDLGALDNRDIKRFPVHEAFKRGWVPNNEKLSRPEAFKRWLSDSSGRFATSALHRTGRGNRLAPDIPSMLTWQARILHLANLEIKNSVVPEFSGDQRWLSKLAATTVEPDGPARVKDMLLEQGIVFVVERHLPKTYLDGAALLSHDGIPIVALTLRYNRLDYFWFTLFHELAHVYLHLFSRHDSDFFDRRIMSRSNEVDTSDPSDRGDLENEADSFALRKVIAPEEWELCQSRQSSSVQKVLADAQRLNVHPSIIAGRIRKERNDFRILGTLLGQGALHQHFAGYRR